MSSALYTYSKRLTHSLSLSSLSREVILIDHTLNPWHIVHVVVSLIQYYTSYVDHQKKRINRRRMNQSKATTFIYTFAFFLTAALNFLSSFANSCCYRFFSYSISQSIYRVPEEEKRIHPSQRSRSIALIAYTTSLLGLQNNFGEPSCMFLSQTNFVISPRGIMRIDLLNGRDSLLFWRTLSFGSHVGVKSLQVKKYFGILSLAFIS